MFSWLRRSTDTTSGTGAARDGDSGRPVDVGWLVNPGQATFLFGAPRPQSPNALAPDYPGSRPRPDTDTGPTRLYEFTCPYDLRLRFGFDANGKPGLRSTTEADRTQAQTIIQTQIRIVPRDRWRHRDRPVIQFGAPWRLVADETVYLSQMPAFHHYREPPLPGLMIGGRYPIHLWPRSLMWAFEWWDTSKDLVLRQGEPWFYLCFETEAPGGTVRLIEAEMTPELQEYCKGLEGVTNYVSQTFQLFKTAQARRPAKLLTPKQRS